MVVPVAVEGELASDHTQRSNMMAMQGVVARHSALAQSAHPSKAGLVTNRATIRL